MIRKERYSVDDILPRIGSVIPLVLDGDTIKVNSLRMQCFKVHGITCVHCGLKGQFFAKEKHHARDKSFHLNLYAVDKGVEVLMTRDHIIALSNNGPDKIENLQTMCTRCNTLKGNKPAVSDGIKSMQIVTRSKKKKALLLISPVVAILIVSLLPINDYARIACSVFGGVPLIVYLCKLFERGMNTLLGIKGKIK